MNIKRSSSRAGEGGKKINYRLCWWGLRVCGLVCGGIDSGVVFGID